jgi:prohibitin 1
MLWLAVIGIILTIFICLFILPIVMRGSKMSDEQKAVKIFIVGFILVFGIILSVMSIVAISAGTVGVKDTFGNVDNDVLQPGLHLKNPLTGVIEFSTKTQKYLEGNSDVVTITALSNEGLTVSMGIAVNYHIAPPMAPTLYKTVGENYPDIIMKQPIHSVPRDIISKYDARTLYSAGKSADNPDRAKIEQELYDGISNGLITDGKSRGVIIENVYIRNIALPDTVTKSIENKMKTDQEIETIKLEVLKAEQGAKVKIAEAHGVAESNRIIANSITQQYLQWYWVENQKTNPNVIYVVPSDNPYPFNIVKDIDNKPGAIGGWGTVTQT